jgi:hypothetical protein
MSTRVFSNVSQLLSIALITATFTSVAYAEGSLSCRAGGGWTGGNLKCDANCTKAGESCYRGQDDLHLVPLSWILGDDDYVTFKTKTNCKCDDDAPDWDNADNIEVVKPEDAKTAYRMQSDGNSAGLAGVMHEITITKCDDPRFKQVNYVFQPFDGFEAFVAGQGGLETKAKGQF